MDESKVNWRQVLSVFVSWCGECLLWPFQHAGEHLFIEAVVMIAGSGYAVYMAVASGASYSQAAMNGLIGGGVAIVLIYAVYLIIAPSQVNQRVWNVWSKTNTRLNDCEDRFLTVSERRKLSRELKDMISNTGHITGPISKATRDAANYHDCFGLLNGWICTFKLKLMDTIWEEEFGFEEGGADWPPSSPSPFPFGSLSGDPMTDSFRLLERTIDLCKQRVGEIIKNIDIL